MSDTWNTSANAMTNKTPTWNFEGTNLSNRVLIMINAEAAPIMISNRKLF